MYSWSQIYGAVAVTLLLVAFVLSIVNAVRVAKVAKRTSGLPDGVTLHADAVADGTNLYLQAKDGTMVGVMTPATLGVQMPPGSASAPLLATSDGRGHTFSVMNASMNGNAQKVVGFILNGDSAHAPALSVGTLAGQSDEVHAFSTDGTAMSVAHAPFGSPVSVVAVQGQAPAPVAPAPAAPAAARLMRSTSATPTAPLPMVPKPATGSYVLYGSDQAAAIRAQGGPRVWASGIPVVWAVFAHPAQDAPTYGPIFSQIAKDFNIAVVGFGYDANIQTYVHHTNGVSAGPTTPIYKPYVVVTNASGEYLADPLGINGGAVNYASVASYLTGLGFRSS